MTHARRLMLLAFTAGTIGSAGAQEMGGPPMEPPAFVRQLFMPSLVMRHQSEIELTDAQREAITKEMAATQQKALELRWQLDQKSEAVSKLVAGDRVDEAAFLARAGEVLDLERQLKEAHLRLLIRIKNALTPAQQAKLAALRQREEPGRRHPPGGPPAGAPPP